MAFRITKRNALIGTLFLLLMAGSYVAGRWRRAGDTLTAQPGGRRILYYQDPMHPSYKSDKPGIAPDCGMQLEPVYADGESGNPVSDAAPGSLPPGTASVTPERQQMIGMRIEAAQSIAATRTMHAVGRVTAEENRIHRIIAATEGWVRQLHGGTTGSLVQRGEVLATFFSRDLLGLQQSLFVASDLQRQAVVSSLMAVGMTEKQILEVEQSHVVAQEIEIAAPATGFVLSRNISPSLRFNRDTELYRIADLTRVWINVDTFERDTGFFNPGAVAHIKLGGPESKVLKAYASNVLPQYDIEKNIFRVRLEADNPGYVLRPDMIVEVEAQVTMPPALIVPAEAVLRSGTGNVIFIDRGSGHFEPRPVTTGWRDGDQVEVVGGLKAGERIVVSGAFLLDSDTRMRAGHEQSSVDPHKDPVCGMDVDESKAKAAGKTATYQGRTYVFCSDDCKQKFEKDPEKYTGAGSRDQKSDVNGKR